MSVCKDFKCYNSVRKICLSTDKICNGIKCKFGVLKCDLCISYDICFDVCIRRGYKNGKNDHYTG